MPKILHIETLPAHSLPKPTESLTGYMIRLAQANSILTVSELSNLLFPRIDARTTRALVDYPLLSFGSLLTATGRLESELLKTTFHYLAVKFGRSTHPQAVSRFLTGSLADHLRYCPLCLQEDPFYSLVWRFQPVVGCPTHNCRLLNECENCGQTIPLFSSPLLIDQCPVCGATLSEFSIIPLDDQALASTRRTSQDLKLLLKPPRILTNELKIGEHLAMLRRAYNMTQQEVAVKASLRKSAVYAIEHCDGDASIRYGAKLSDYVQYAELMGISFSELCSELCVEQERAKRPICHTKRKGRAKSITAINKAARVQSLCRQVQQAVTQLIRDGNEITQTSIAKMLHISRKGLKYYPKVSKLVTRLCCQHKLGKYKRQNELLTFVRKAVDNLSTEGKKITRIAIAKRVGLSPKSLARYPEVCHLLEELVSADARRRRIDRGQELLHRVKQAENQILARGMDVTQTSIADHIGMSLSGLKYYSAVRLYLEQHVPSLHTRSQHKNQSEIARQVEDFVEFLKTQGTAVTWVVVAEGIGRSVGSLKYYPKVKEIMSEHVERNDNRKRYSKELEILENVRVTMDKLRREGKRISQRTVAKSVGMSQSGLRYYPRVLKFVNQHSDTGKKSNPDNLER